MHADGVLWLACVIRVLRTHPPSLGPVINNFGWIWLVDVMTSRCFLPCPALSRMQLGRFLKSYRCDRKRGATAHSSVQKTHARPGGQNDKKICGKRNEMHELGVAIKCEHVALTNDFTSLARMHSRPTQRSRPGSRSFAHTSRKSERMNQM